MGWQRSRLGLNPTCHSFTWGLVYFYNELGQLNWVFCYGQIYLLSHSPMTIYPCPLEPGSHFPFVLSFRLLSLAPETELQVLPGTGLLTYFNSILGTELQDRLLNLFKFWHESFQMPSGIFNFSLNS